MALQPAVNGCRNGNRASSHGLNLHRAEAVIERALVPWFDPISGETIFHYQMVHCTQAQWDRLVADGAAYRSWLVFAHPISGYVTAFSPKIDGPVPSPDHQLTPPHTSGSWG